MQSDESTATPFEGSGASEIDAYACSLVKAAAGRPLTEQPV